MNKKYIIRLEPEERARLLALVTRGKHSARKINRARVLLLADKGKGDKEIVDILDLGLATVQRIRQRYCQGGLEEAIERRPHPGRAPILNQDGEELICSLAESNPPEGARRWTLQRLADHLVESEAVSSISPDTIARVLKRHGIKLQRAVE